MGHNEMLSCAPQRLQYQLLFGSPIPSHAFLPLTHSATVPSASNTVTLNFCLARPLSSSLPQLKCDFLGKAFSENPNKVGLPTSTCSLPIPTLFWSNSERKLPPTPYLKNHYLKSLILTLTSGSSVNSKGSRQCQQLTLSDKDGKEHGCYRQSIITLDKTGHLLFLFILLLCL